MPLTKIPLIDVHRFPKGVVSRDTQPDHTKWTITDTTAFIPKQDFLELPEYSCSMPSGVYPGKIWKCDINAYSVFSEKAITDIISEEIPKGPKWVLRWYDWFSNRTEICGIHQRDIIVFDEKPFNLEEECSHI